MVYFSSFNGYDVKDKLARETNKSLQTQINQLISGSPLVASSVSNMSDTSRVYVNTTDGYWYYYSGSEWVQGGQYQSSKVGDKNISQSKLNDILQEVLYQGFTWEIGSITTSGEDTGTSTRIRTPGIQYVNAGTTIKISDSSSYKYAIHYFDDDGNFESQTGFKTADTTILESTNIRFIVAYSNDATIDESLVDFVGNQLKVIPSTSIVNQVSTDRIKDKAITTSKLDDKSVNQLKLDDKLQKYLLTTFEWALGTVLSDGTTDSNYRRVHTNKLYLEKGTTIYLEDEDNFKYAVHIYKSDGETYDKQTGWITTKTTITQDGYYRLVMGMSDDSDLTSIIDDVTNNLTIYTPSSLFYKEDGVILNPLDANVKAVAHRGYSSIAPENTLPAYTLAKKKGFSYVECDVIFTSDGIPVLSHLDDLSICTNGTGNVSESTYEYISSLDAGRWKSEEYAGTKVPTFKEFIILCKQLNIHPYIEIKIATHDQVRELYSICKSYGMTKKVTWIGALEFLRVLIEVDPSCRVGWVTSNLTEDGITSLTALQTGQNEVFADLNYTTVDQTVSTLCTNAGIGLECYTINDLDNLVSMTELGVTGITTDSLNVIEELTKYYE